MSTKMSKDLHIERSSTRLHAPPGGKTSFSLGDAITPTTHSGSHSNNNQFSNNNNGNTSSTHRRGAGAATTSLANYFDGPDNIPPKVSNVPVSTSKSLGEYMKPAQPTATTAPAAAPFGAHAPAKTISGNGYRVRQQPGGNSSIVIG
jgi:hypothetical protein